MSDDSLDTCWERDHAARPAEYRCQHGLVIDGVRQHVAAKCPFHGAITAYRVGPAYFRCPACRSTCQPQEA